MGRLRPLLPLLFFHPTIQSFSPGALSYPPFHTTTDFSRAFATLYVDFWGFRSLVLKGRLGF